LACDDFFVLQTSHRGALFRIHSAALRYRGAVARFPRVAMAPFRNSLRFVTEKDRALFAYIMITLAFGNVRR
jgi:hypothetical protein